MKMKDYVKTLVEEFGIEGVLEFLSCEPEEALLALHEIGTIDLERMKEYWEDEDSQEQ